MKIQYFYEVVESKSPTMKIHRKFVTHKPFYTKKLGKIVELSDVHCKPFFIKLIKIKELKEKII